MQDAEWRTAADGRNVFVAYSLGNFLSTQSKPDQLIGAVLTLYLIMRRIDFEGARTAVNQSG